MEITLLNLVPIPDTGEPRLHALLGDARDLASFADGSFDLVHSNSLIEHLPTFADRRKMAAEVQRVGDAYFIQTPNRYFPIEPHFILPLFQFWPPALRRWVAHRYRPGWYRLRKKQEAAEEDAQTIRLLNAKELQQLFPDGQLWRERWMFLTKSLVISRGFH